MVQYLAERGDRTEKRTMRSEPLSPFGGCPATQPIGQLCLQRGAILHPRLVAGVKRVVDEFGQLDGRAKPRPMVGSPGARHGVTILGFVRLVRDDHGMRAAEA